MELKIKDQKDNKLLSRIEINALLGFQGATPSNDKVRELIAKQMNKEAKLVVVKNIYTKFGSQSADVSAYVYADENKLKQIEPGKKDKKGAKKEEAPAEASPKLSNESEKGLEKENASQKEEAKEVPKEEAPAEEKKEETPKQEAKEDPKKE
ncbi:MAG: hypothetical protein KAU20_04890 [Nanoarchaeota archaeon]|nr:hypothetical protein [Nanoarchaeota archaeon]